MKILVVYDSLYGNTEQIARAIAGAISPPGEVTLSRVGEVSMSQLRGPDLIVVGAPTQGFRPSKPVQGFLEGIPAGHLEGVCVAAFDTRIAEADVGRGLRLLIKVGGYAAKHIGEALTRKSGRLVVPPEGFLVKDREGPLREGESERAAGWGEEVARSCAASGVRQ